MPPANHRRRTDYGTVIFHSALVSSFLVLIATGLRIASDDPATTWLAMLDPFLPTENLWYVHLLASVALMAVLAGYVCYIAKARLFSRSRLDKARFVQMSCRGRKRWGALGVLVHWVLMVSLAGEVLTGCLLFSGAGGYILDLHRQLTFLSIITVVVHVGLHAASGGVTQLLSIVRAAPLRIQPPPPDFAELLADVLARQRPAEALVEPIPEHTITSDRGKPLQPVVTADRAGAPTRLLRPAVLRLHPFATALAVVVAVVIVAVGAEQATRPSLRIVAIDPAAAPALDGDLSDPAWTTAAPKSVLTMQGGDFGGGRQSLVEIRAMHDGEFAYFAFVWEDPTRSLKHLPLFKSGGQWYAAAERSPPEQELKFHEDKFAVLLSGSVFPLIGGAIHLSGQPSSRPDREVRRGLHYTTNGTFADVWQWHASHNEPIGYIEDGHFGPRQAVQLDPDNLARPDTGGFAIDPGRIPYRSNFHGQLTLARTPVVPLRLPRNPSAIAQAMGRLTTDTSVSESEDARWWMTMANSIAFSKEADGKIPDGTVIPSILMATDLESGTDSIRGRAQWAAGHWALELRRRLNASSRYDVPIRSGNLLWVAAFDHAGKRHTRHLRPFELEVD